MWYISRKEYGQRNTLRYKYYLVCWCRSILMIGLHCIFCFQISNRIQMVVNSSHYILPCKVVGQPSSITPILIRHFFSLDQWDFVRNLLLITAWLFALPKLQRETFTSHPGTEPFASDPDVTCDLLLFIAAAAQCWWHVRFVESPIGRWWGIALVFAHYSCMCVWSILLCRSEHVIWSYFYFNNKTWF